MKLLTLTILSAFFLIGSISTSMAHCGACGEADNHAEMSKPCEKCAMSGKTCGCGDKAKICTKSMNKDKPCAMCDKSEHKWEANKRNMTTKNVNTEKGSLKIIKTKPMMSTYND